MALLEENSLVSLKQWEGKPRALGRRTLRTRKAECPEV